VPRTFRGRPPGLPGSGDGTRAAWRDASWYRKPGTASKYHVVGDDSGSACNGAPLPLESAGLPVRDQTVPAASVEEHLRCQRRGCKERWPVADERPVVLLDVDGVINLARFRSSAERSRLVRAGWFHRKPADPFLGDRLLVNLGEVLAAVEELVTGCLEAGADLAWGTTWGRSANDVFYPLLGLSRYGLPVLPVAPVNFDLSAKAYTVIPWTEGRPWAWLEDQERELALASALTRRGTSCCPVLVDRATGLTTRHAETVTTWLRGL